ncbi:hypothetical protein ACTA71_010229 [Dictyostelium dimigraforme]
MNTILFGLLVEKVNSSDVINVICFSFNFSIVGDNGCLLLKWTLRCMWSTNLCEASSIFAVERNKTISWWHQNSINNSIKTESTTITAASKTIAVSTPTTKQKQQLGLFDLNDSNRNIFASSVPTLLAITTVVLMTFNKRKDNSGSSIKLTFSTTRQFQQQHQQQFYQQL